MAMKIGGSTAMPVSESEHSPHRPLEGIVVLELAHYVAGPTICRIMLDLGATVIKIEPPGGEAMRRSSPPGDWVPSPTHLALHRDKLNVVLDLKAPSGLEAFNRMVAKADVVVENFRPGVPERLKIGPADLSAINKRLIYCTLNGFGAGGPFAPMPVTDGVVQAFSGILQMLAPRGHDFAPPATFAIGDLFGGATAAQAVLAALYARERTGVGSHIQMNMLECALFARMLSTERGMVSPNTFVAQTSDGVNLVIQTVPAIIPRFLDMLRTLPGCEDIADDARFSTVEARIENEQAYLARLRDAFVQRPAADWIELFMKAGIPASPINTMDEALHHDQVTLRHAYSDLTVPGLGDIRLPASPFVFDGQRKTATEAPGLLGADTAWVLKEIVGYTSSELEAFQADQDPSSLTVGTLG
jgi:crotonobetainyl-CoA:carnitine CoA-transferase CaiB-like acyl-CoA transferase